jgi:membrane fusion protein (multidrug efflux system)
MQRLSVPPDSSIRGGFVRLMTLMATGMICVALAACDKPAPKATARQPVQVGVVTVQPQRHVERIELPGRTRAMQVAEIRPQVGGIVRQRLFEEGSQVKAGQVLYQIDPASFEATAASAHAGVARAEAAVNVARVSERRLGELARVKAVSQQEHDDSRGALQAAEADLAAAKAVLKEARIGLERTRITAPIAGRIETSAVSVGALVTANQAAPLTLVQQLDPLYVDVSQSSADLLKLKQRLASGALQKGTAREAPIRLMLEDGTAYAHEGRLRVSGGSVDPATGAVTIRALVPNPEGLLMPGMYVSASLEAGVVEQALLVPQQGVTRTPKGDASALVVVAGNKVERRTLRLERTVGSMWHVSAGLKAGDVLIVEGGQRVKPGEVVQPVQAGQAEQSKKAAQPAKAQR